MEQEKSRTLREQKIRQWFAMWLEKRDSGVASLFAPDAVYIESWGPEYHGAAKIQLWFEEWNRRGQVKVWDILQFLHQENQTAVFWRFHCQMDDGTEQKFDGVSLIRWTEQNQIGKRFTAYHLKREWTVQFGCHIERYDPYEKGSVPVFRRQDAFWF